MISEKYNHPAGSMAIRNAADKRFRVAKTKEAKGKDKSAVS
jgi:hypothetical protein